MAPQSTGRAEMVIERRIMKRSDFSFQEPSIHIGKNKLTKMAKIAKKCNTEGHLECLTIIANIFCGVNDFKQYWTNGIYDFTLKEAIKSNPDIVIKRFKAVAKFCCTDFDRIKAIAGSLHCDSIHQ